MHVYTWLHTFADIMFPFRVGTEHRVRVSSLWSGHPLHHVSLKAGVHVEVIQAVQIRVSDVHY